MASRKSSVEKLKFHLGIHGKFTVDKFPLPGREPNALVPNLIQKYTWLDAHGWKVCLQLGLYWFVISLLTSAGPFYRAVSYFPAGVQSNIGAALGTMVILDGMGFSVVLALFVVVLCIVAQSVITYPVLYLIWLCNGLNWLPGVGKAAWMFAWVSVVYGAVLLVRVRVVGLERMLYMAQLLAVMMIIMQMFPVVSPPPTHPLPLAVPIFWGLLMLSVLVGLLVSFLVFPTKSTTWLVGYLANDIRKIGFMFHLVFRNMVDEGETGDEGLEAAGRLQEEIYDDLEANGGLSLLMSGCGLDFNIYNVMWRHPHSHRDLPASIRAIYVLCRSIVKTTSSPLLLAKTTRKNSGLAGSSLIDDALRRHISDESDSLVERGQLLSSACQTLGDALVNRGTFASALVALAAVEQHALRVVKGGMPAGGDIHDKLAAMLMHGNLWLTTNLVRRLFECGSVVVVEYQPGAIQAMQQHAAQHPLFKSDKGFDGTPGTREAGSAFDDEPAEDTSLLHSVTGQTKKTEDHVVKEHGKKKKKDDKGRQWLRHKPYDESYWGPMAGRKLQVALERIHDQTGFDWFMIRQFMQLQTAFMVALLLFVNYKFSSWTQMQSILYVVYSMTAYPREVARNAAWAVMQCCLVCVGVVVGSVMVVLLHALTGGSAATDWGKAALMALVVGVFGVVLQSALQRAHVKYSMNLIICKTNLLTVALTAFTRTASPWQMMFSRLFCYHLAWVTALLAQLIIFPISSKEACRYFIGQALEVLDGLQTHVTDSLIGGDVQEEQGSPMKGDVKTETVYDRGPTASSPALMHNRAATIELQKELSALLFCRLPSCMLRANMNLDALFAPHDAKFKLTTCRRILQRLHMMELNSLTVLNMMDAVGLHSIGQVSASVREAAGKVALSTSRALRGLRYYSMGLLSSQQMRKSYNDLYNDSMALVGELEEEEGVPLGPRLVRSYMIAALVNTLLSVPFLMRHLAEVFWSTQMVEMGMMEDMESNLPWPMKDQQLNRLLDYIVRGYSTLEFHPISEYDESGMSEEGRVLQRGASLVAGLMMSRNSLRTPQQDIP